MVRLAVKHRDWVYTANGSGDFTNCLANPEELEMPIPTRCNNVDDFVNQLDEIPLPVHIQNPIQSKSLFELEEDLDQLLEAGEQEVTVSREAPISDNESVSIIDKTQTSDLIGNYVQDLKSIKRPRISNTKLLDGVGRVSRSIEGCINLAESTTLGIPTVGLAVKHRQGPVTGPSADSLSYGNNY